MTSFAKQHKALIRRWLPQGARDLCNYLSGRAIRYQGVFASWNQAEAAAPGYSESHLLQRLERSALAVKNGDACWEQDGVIHEDIPVDFPLLACLAQVALANDGKLSVLDFGGGFGSSYHQCHKHLHGLQMLRWSIVEQAPIAISGQRQFEDESLRFYQSLEACLQEEQPQVILLSSVLQYLEYPYKLLDTIATSPISFLLIDRHPASINRELITLQKIPASIYQASYASWLFDCTRMWAMLDHNYSRLLEWEGKDPPIYGYGIGAHFVGGFWQRRQLK